MTTLTAQLNGPLSSVPISQSLAIIKPLIESDRNVVSIKSMPNITNATSLVNTTVAKSQSPLINFTFTSSDLCLNSAAFTSQPTNSFSTITVAREIKSEALQVSAIQKPIIVTVSGLPGISQGNRQQLPVISNIASKILSTPIQAMALSDKFHPVTSVPASDQKPIFPQNFASLPCTNVTVLPKPNISTSTLVPPPPTLTSVIPPASFSSTPVSYSSVTPTVLPSSTGMTSTVAFTVPMTSVQVSQSCSTISVLPVISTSNLHTNDKLLPALSPPCLTPIKTSKTVDSSAEAATDTSKFSQLESQDAANNKLLPDSLNDDFDPIEAMEWKNGIAHLPGSDLKFKLGEFGTLEVITDDSFEKTGNSDPQTSLTKENSNEQEKKITIKSEENNGKLEKLKQPKNSVAVEDKICCCENCGCHGLTSEFKSSGRFCSESCLSEYGQKSNIPKKSPSIAPKKLKRQTSLLNNAENAAEVEKKLMKSAGFTWNTYLEKEKAIRAPSKLFQNHQIFPTSKHNFRVGMKLEGIDPRHPSMFCVLTVAEVCGFRLRLHFDGYSDCYDFWINADSSDIFPAEWCEQTGHKLSPPKGYAVGEFNWTNYLRMSKSQAAPRSTFLNNSHVSEPHGFKIGMKLEAVDKKNGFLVCVATVTDVLDNRFLVHFDGWDDDYDYWVVPSSPFIHPINWCSENGHVLTPPNNYKENSPFSWKSYLSETNSQPVPTSAFKKRPPHGFKAGMKLEAVDKRNTMLLRVATIADVQPHLIKLHFDGWSDAYDYWVEDDSPDIHPVNWCYRTGHPLQPPINSNNITPQGQGGCPTPGCRGIGHIKGPKFITHHSAFGCPYSQLNMNKDTALQDRLGPPRSEKLLDVGPLHRYTETSGATDALRKCPTLGCDGTGHITGRYSVHHRMADCPLAQSQIELMNGDDSHDSDVAKQVKAPLGRGRKRKHLIEDKKKLYTSESPKLEQPTLQDSIHKSVFSTPLIPDPLLESSLCWEQHSKFLSGTRQVMGNVLKWSVEQVANYVSRLSGCEEYSKLFSDEQIDGEAFLLLNQTDIVNILNIKLGPALKIYNSILSFKKSIGD